MHPGLDQLARLLRLRGTAGEQATADADEEIRFHLETRIAELISEGWPEREARRQALREFGDPEAARRELARLSVGRERRARRGEYLGGLRRDLAYGWRRLRRTPGFTIVAVLTLALGIGATAAIFSVINGVLLKPLPFAEPDRLVSIWHTGRGEGRAQMWVSDGTYFTYREEGRVFEDVGLWDDAHLTVTGLAEPERVEALGVTDGTLTLLGVRPALGRLFTAADVDPGNPVTVILSHGYWRRALGSDPDAVGRTLTINGIAAEIIGILPPRFRFLDQQPDVLYPLRFDRSRVSIGGFNYRAIARLRPGATLEDARVDLARVLPLTLEKFPGNWTQERMREIGLAPLVHPLEQDVVGDVDSALWLVFGAVGIVLLIACANVAGLFLVRAERRQREIAVCTAIGAGWRRIAREYVLESVILGLLGGAVGLALAYGGLQVLASIGPGTLPRLDEIAIDPLVLIFTLVVSLLAALFFGLFPIIGYRRADLAVALKEGGRGGGVGRRQRARNVMVVAQMALALVLLIGSGLMVRSALELRRVNPGFERPQEVLTFALSVPSGEVRERAAAALTHEEIARAIGSVPGIVSVGLSSSVPMTGVTSTNSTYVEDFPVPEGESAPSRRNKFVSGDYFATLGIPLLAGRAIEWADIERQSTVAVVSENLAREYWSEPALAVGKRIRSGREGPWTEIVGVVGNVHDDGVDRAAPTIVYWPLLVTRFWGMEIFVWRAPTYVVRTMRIDDPSLLSRIRAAVWSVNPNLPPSEVRTLGEIMARSTARTSFVVVLLSIAAVVALLLGLVGLYAVISYAVSTRRREIGIRMALGARERDVTLRVLRQGLFLASAGMAIGLSAAVGLTRLMAALLFGVQPLDPTTFVTMSVGLALIALLATYVPARRAAAVDPVEALREE